MFSPAKIIVSLSLSMILISCGNEAERPAYSDILSQPAFAGLTDSINQDPSNDGLYYRRAAVLHSNNYLEPALADLRKAWSLRKEERYAIGISGLLLTDHPDSAILFLKDQGLKALPGSLMLQMNLAQAYASTGKPDLALEICNTILGRLPDQTDVLKLKADLLEDKGDKTGAISALEQAYRITPYDIELNYILALKLAEQKDARLLSLCDSLITVDSLGTHAEPDYYKGIYYANLGEKQKAITAFEKALTRDYYFLDAYIEKASVQYELRKYAEALKTLQLLLTLSPKNADGYYWVGRCLEATGDKEQANLNYQKALGLDGGMKEAKDGLERTK